VELFVFCSSLAAGGPARSHDRPRRESDTPQPISAYGQSKLVAERWLEENPGNGMRLLTVRPPAVYGPRDEMILSFFRWAKWGLLPLPGHGGRGLSLIHVRDLVQGCLGLAERGASGTFNLSDGRIYRWEDVGEATGRAIGRRLRPVRIPAAAVRLAGAVGELIGRVSGNMPAVNRQKVHDLLQPYWICDTRKARDHGFEPRIFLDEGIRETVAWYRAEGWL
jgi:nucleoside-diphosphate-sugar epimerase